MLKESSWMWQFLRGKWLSREQFHSRKEAWSQIVWHLVSGTRGMRGYSFESYFPFCSLNNSFPYLQGMESNRFSTYPLIIGNWEFNFPRESSSWLYRGLKWKQSTACSSNSEPPTRGVEENQDNGKLAWGKIHSVCSVEVLVFVQKENIKYQVNGMKKKTMSEHMLVNAEFQLCKEKS